MSGWAEAIREYQRASIDPIPEGWASVDMVAKEMGKDYRTALRWVVIMFKDGLLEKKRWQLNQRHYGFIYRRRGSAHKPVGTPKVKASKKGKKTLGFT